MFALRKPEYMSVRSGITSSLPESAHHGSFVLSPGVVVSPGGNSFGNYINRTSTRKAHRKMTHRKGKKVVHRNEGVVNQETDESDPIREYRAQPGYAEIASTCNVPGAEIVRIAQNPASMDAAEVMSVDHHRHKLMDKIKTNVIRERIERIAQLDQLRRERQRNGEEIEPDESSPLLGADTTVDDNLSFGLFHGPDHLLPASFYQLHIPGGRYFKAEPEHDGKANSFVTVLSIWNTMMGTSLLSVPWAFQMSGLAAGLMIGSSMATIAGFTAMTIVGVHRKFDSPAGSIPEFAQLCGKLLGPRWEILAGLTSLGAVTGAAIVYWVLMSNFLYNSVSWVHQNAAGTLPNSTESVICPKNNTAPSIHHVRLIDDSSLITIINATDGSFLNDEVIIESDFDRVWNPATVPFFLLVLFPVICLRSVTFFTKFNSLGSVSVAFILAMISYWCYKWGINADFHNPDSDEYVPLFLSSFPSLSGMLALGLFIHNAIITICKNNKHQENNKRDVCIAFCCVIGTYLFVGVMFYISFPLPKWCIEDNFFNNFEITDLAVVVGRILLLFQLFTVFPLIMYILRVQLLILLKLSEERMFNIVVVNISVCTVCILFAIFMPNIGTIIRYSGALCGFCMIFTLPVLVKMAALKRTETLTWRHIAVYSAVVLLGFSNLIAQFLFK